LFQPALILVLVLLAVSAAAAAGAMWAYYDTSKVHCLTSFECKQLAQWLYSRIPILFRNMVARANRDKSREEQNRLVVEHLPFLLPGTSEEIVRPPASTLARQQTPNASGWGVRQTPGSSASAFCACVLALHLFQSCYFVASLALNSDGRVTRDEFVKCWNRHARVIFPSSRQKSSERGTVYCTIL